MSATHPDRDMIDRVIERENGYVDHPMDRGGPTNFGVTQGTLSDWRGAPASADDVEHMSRDEARAIYQERYVDGPGYDQLPAGLAPAVVDMGVNAGPRNATTLLQNTLNSLGYPVATDGRMGPETVQAAQDAYAADGRATTNNYVAERRAYYNRIAAAHPTQQVFLRGWLARADTFLVAGATPGGGGPAGAQAGTVAAPGGGGNGDGANPPDGTGAEADDGATGGTGGDGTSDGPQGGTDQSNRDEILRELGSGSTDDRGGQDDHDDGGGVDVPGPT